MQTEIDAESKRLATDPKELDNIVFNKIGDAMTRGVQRMRNSVMDLFDGSQRSPTAQSLRDTIHPQVKPDEPTTEPGAERGANAQER